MVHPTISVTWEKDDNPSWSPEVEKIVKEQMEEVQKEIDDSVMLELLVDGGWTKVPFMFYNSKHAIDVHIWCEENIKLGQWQRLCGTYVFRKKQDAEWFILRWL